MSTALSRSKNVFEVPEALEFNQMREVNLKTLSH